jgi:hypothetical protein
MNATAPQAAGPPMGLIIGGVVLIVVIIVIVLWQTGVFKSEPDAVSSGPGPSPGPMAPGPSPGPMAPGPSPGPGSMSENVMNIKKYYDAKAPTTPCPDGSTKMAILLDSIGVKAVKGSLCPDGFASFDMKPTGEISLCYNLDVVQKLQARSNEIDELYRKCYNK